MIVIHSIPISKLSLFSPWLYLVSELSWPLSPPMNHLLNFLSPVEGSEGAAWVSAWPGSTHCTPISAPGTEAQFLKYLQTNKGLSTALGSRERGRPHPSDSVTATHLAIECKYQKMHPFSFYDYSFVHSGPPLFPFVLILAFLLSLPHFILRKKSCKKTPKKQ